MGNIQVILDSIAPETQAYEYDMLNRLSKWMLEEVEKTYTYNSAGNLEGKEGIALTYGDSSHPHAVTASGTNSYGYDANGNMTNRGPAGQQYTLAYDADGRVVMVSGPSGFSAAFTYDGDGQRVKQVINGVTTDFVGNYYEKTGTTVTKYYYAGTARIGMRKYTIPQSMVVEYLLGDHLGSTSLTTDANGGKVSEMRYTPWGEVRYAWKDPALNTTPAYELTRWTFTGQYSDSYINLLWYGSRHYDPELGRFISPDSIVPDPNNPQAYDRYSYAFNNPVKYTDPTGHKPCWATNRYSCGLNNTDIWKLKHGSTDEQRFIENLLGTPTRHTVYVGGFMVPVGVGRLDQDEGTNRITNKLQWLIELIALLKDIGENFQPSVSEPNVHTYFSYDQYENGYVDNTAISVENGSGANVYVSYIIFAIDRPDHFDCTTPCGEFPIMSTASDYLATVKPGETADISMCSNCWASPGIVGFLPIANGQQVNIGIGFLVPAMTIPKFELQTDLVSWR